MEKSKIIIATNSAKKDSAKVAFFFRREVFIADPSCLQGCHLFELYFPWISQRKKMVFLITRLYHWHDRGSLNLADSDIVRN